jgi:hypothetical protein
LQNYLKDSKIGTESLEFVSNDGLELTKGNIGRLSDFKMALKPGSLCPPSSIE